ILLAVGVADDGLRSARKHFAADGLQVGSRHAQAADPELTGDVSGAGHPRLAPDFGALQQDAIHEHPAATGRAAERRERGGCDDHGSSPRFLPGEAERLPVSSPSTCASPGGGPFPKATKVGNPARANAIPQSAAPVRSSAMMVSSGMLHTEAVSACACVRRSFGAPGRPTRRYHHAVTIGTRMAVTTTLVATSTVADAAAGLYTGFAAATMAG